MGGGALKLMEDFPVPTKGHFGSVGSSVIGLTIVLPTMLFTFFHMLIHKKAAGLASVASDPNDPQKLVGDSDSEELGDAPSKC